MVGAPLHTARMDFESALRRTGGNVSATARALGIGRNTAQRWKRELMEGGLRVRKLPPAKPIEAEPNRWRTPLRWPGGKSRQARMISGMFPYDVPVMSPFVGGASVELALARRGHDVRAFDIDETLVNFWRQALTDPVRLVGMAGATADPEKLTRDQFLDMRDRLPHVENDLERAAWFFILNRSSFSGTTTSGGYSPKAANTRYTPSALKRLGTFRPSRFRVDRADFRDAIPRFPKRWLYCDPPYRLGGRADRLYGRDGKHHDGFDHDALARLLRLRDRWVLSYNDCDWVRDTYAGCKIATPKWSYSMRKTDKRSSEVLVTP